MRSSVATCRLPLSAPLSPFSSSSPSSSSSSSSSFLSSSSLQSRQSSRFSPQQHHRNLLTASLSAAAAAAASLCSSSSCFRSSAGSSATSYTPLRGYTHSVAPDRIRNVAIIAHVDHGKTSLVDQLLRSCGTVSDQDRVMDSNSLERERGITILSKCTSIQYKDHQVNILDTPGHGDFGGEVERILNMVDGVVLIVDASEGVGTQTKFVLTKALGKKLRPLVVLNKMDRPTRDVDRVEGEVFDLFCKLHADDSQLEYTTLYASAREGWAATEPDQVSDSMTPLLDAIIEHLPPPNVDLDSPFRMLVTLLDSDDHMGKLVTGRVLSGRVRPGDLLKALDEKGAVVEENVKVTRVLMSRGLAQEPVDDGAGSGDVVSIAGFSRATVNSTLCAPAVSDPIPSDPIDPPVLSLAFQVNTGPMAGRDGKRVTAALLEERLGKEAETNVALRIQKQGDGDFLVSGRGELQLGILLENMRREGFELLVSPPSVVLREDEHGDPIEPVEEVVIEVESRHANAVSDMLSKRGGELQETLDQGGDITRLHFEIPSRGLIGFRSVFMRLTRGQGNMNHNLVRYDPVLPETRAPERGALVSNAMGKATSYALAALEPRGQLFVQPNTEVYPGMVVGENNRAEEMLVNPTKTKHLTNVRASGNDENIRLAPPRLFTLEEALAYVAADEYVEVTPNHIRFRKQELDENKRARATKDAKNARKSGKK